MNVVIGSMGKSLKLCVLHADSKQFQESIVVTPPICISKRLVR